MFLEIYVCCFHAGADYDELVKMTGDKSRVFNIDDFDKLSDIVESVKKTTCKGQYKINTSDS